VGVAEPGIGIDVIPSAAIERCFGGGAWPKNVQPSRTDVTMLTTAMRNASGGPTLRRLLIAAARSP
jgi:hypothetical protein